MTERLSDKLREYLQGAQGREVNIKDLRTELKIDPTSPAWDSLGRELRRFVEEKIVRPSGRKDGIYKVITQVKAVSVYGKKRRPPIQINFPKDFDTGMEMLFAEDLIIREGDLILLSGRSNFGKTTLCMNFAGENILLKPVLMGNEYTTLDNEPSPRFLHRLDTMDWINWGDENGDNFILLPVRADYAEHIVKDRINIIDWINIDTGEHYLIGSIMESIKRELGKGIAIIAIQKAEGAESGRGGQFTKDFADVEILLDKLPESEDVLLTLGKIKESKKRVSGRTFAYGIFQGVKITNFREIVKCKNCFGKGWKLGKPCEDCNRSGFQDK